MSMLRFVVIASPGVGDFKTAKAKTVIDATGIAVEQLSA